MDPLSGLVIEARLRDLAGFTDVPGELTRLTLSPAHHAAVGHLSTLFRNAGMDVWIDGTGSLVGRYVGASDDGGTLLIGSHVDTVRNAGIYDGNLGVLTGLSVIESLHLQGVRLPYAIELIAFGDEEGVRFPTTLTGSRAVAGRFDPACLDEVDQDGITRRAALAAFGAPVSKIPSIPRDPGKLVGYLEVHIEQGPVLEARGLPVGVVTAINGASRGDVTVSGTAGHAGTLPMPMRHDAVAAAAEMILGVERHASSHQDLVATAGVFETPGGAVNVVAGRARFTLDVRCPDDAHRKAAVADIEAMVADVARRRSVTAKVDLGHDAPATPCDPQLTAVIERVVARHGIAPLRIASGAGHDGMSLRDRIRFAMLFIRCRGGVSHNPAEYATPDDIGLGAKILRDVLLDLAVSR